MSKDLRRHLTKEGMHMANKQMKRCSTAYVLGDYKWNYNSIATPTYLLEWPKSKMLTTGNADEMCNEWEQQEHSFILGRNAKSPNHIGRHFGSFLQN